MYKYTKPRKTTLGSVPRVEGESIEMKVQRITKNKEAIKDGAPDIFTERKDGVLPAYNVRTDRFEIATEAMDSIHRSKVAQRENKPTMKVVKNEEKKEENNGGAEPIQGTDNK